MDKTAKMIRIAAVALAVSALAVLLFTRLRGLVFTIVTSILLAYLLTKPLKRLERQLKRVGALLALLGLLAGAAALFFIYFVPLLIRQAADLAAYIPKVLQSITDSLTEAGKSAGAPTDGIISQALVSFNTQVAQWLGNTTINLAQGGYSGLGWALLLPVFTFYFLKDREYFLDQFHYLIPLKRQGDLHALYVAIDKSLGRFMRGQLMISFIVAVMVTAALTVIGVPNAPLLGLICGLCNMIPFVGPFIGVIPVALVSASLGWRALVFSAASVLAVQLLDNAVISPKIIGDSLRIHPAYVIAAIIVGSGLFGVMGLLFALPALIVFKEVTVFAFRKRLGNGRTVQLDADKNA